jgi:hypothetical protein
MDVAVDCDSTSREGGEGVVTVTGKNADIDGTGSGTGVSCLQEASG